MINPLEQFVVKEIIPLEVNGMNLSVTNSALFMILSVLTALLFLIFCLWRRQIIPGFPQAISESLYRFVEKIGVDAVEKNADKYLPFLFSVFIFFCLGFFLRIFI